MNQANYSVHQLAELSGVSVRTLHHYDQIGLLVPARSANGYRRYGEREVERLQHIMLYRACGMPLSQIGELLDSPSFSQTEALHDHLERLLAQRRKLDQAIRTVQQTLTAAQKGIAMSDRDRFEGLKREAIDKNEKEYGAEARMRWGDEAVDAANEAMLALDEGAWSNMQALEEHIKALLKAAMAEGDPTGPAARELIKAHARWLELHWGSGAYTPEAHRGLADGYLADERFVAYYDGACGTGATQFLHDAIHALL